MAELEAIVADYLAAGRDLGRDPCRRPVRPDRASSRRAVMTDIDDLGRLGARAAQRAGPRDRRARRPLRRAPRARRGARARTTCSPSPREFGDSAVAKLRTVLAVYEALRASEDSAG